MAPVDQTYFDGLRERVGGAAKAGSNRRLARIARPARHSGVDANAGRGVAADG